MSADNYYLIRKHPLGGFAAINASASDDRTPKAEKRHQQFARALDALHYALGEYSEYGVQVHDECEPALSEERQAENVERFRKALMEAHADDWTMEVISEAAHICAAAWEAHITVGEFGGLREAGRHD